MSSGKHFHNVLCLSEAKGMDIIMIVMVTLKEVSRTRNYRNYALVYNGDTYRLSVYFGEKSHDKLWECDKKIPEDVVSFVKNIITKELTEFQARVGEIVDVFEDWIMEARRKGTFPPDYELTENDIMEIKKHVIDMIYNYK